MKKIQKYLLFFALLSGTTALVSSCDEKEFSENYDIPWKVSTITSITPITASAGSSITLAGTNLGDDLVPDGGFYMGTTVCTIVSQTAASVVITVPAGITEPVDVSVRNLHNRTYVYKDKFVPILP